MQNSTNQYVVNIYIDSLLIKGGKLAITFCFWGEISVWPPVATHSIFCSPRSSVKQDGGLYVFCQVIVKSSKYE